MRIEIERGRPSAQRHAPRDEAYLNSLSNLLYGNKIGISTLKAIAAGPHPRFLVVLAKVRLVDMGVHI